MSEQNGLLEVPARGLTGVAHKEHMSQRAYLRDLEERSIAYVASGLQKLLEAADCKRCVQVEPRILSRSLHTFTRLKYGPVRLLQALDDVVCSGDFSPWMADLACCCEICWCMATFGCFRRPLWAAAMAGVDQAQPDSLSLALQFQIVASILLAQQAKCVLLGAPCLYCF